MMPRVVPPPCRSSLESLETRRLLAWGAFPQLIDQDLAAANFPSITGTGSTVVMLDTGIDYNHPDLGGGWGKKVIYGWDYVNNDSDPMDTVGHGTGVASVAAGLPFTFNNKQYSGIAPGASIIALRTDDGTDDFNVDAQRVHAALQWVLANQAKYNIVALNISTGSGFYKTAVSQSPCAADFAALADAGVLVAACSGNDGTTNPGTIEYPAADPNVYAVGATNVNDQVSSFSSRNSLTDLMAPGENVTLAYYNPATGSHYYLDYGNGTSFSSPALVGMSALLKQVNPSLTVAQEMSIIQGTADYVYDSVTKQSYPRLNVNNALMRAVEWAGVKGPFSGTPVAVGGQIEAENFDKGGEGFAYHDVTPANLGGKYRASAVDIESCSAGGYDVGWNQAGEWLNYTVNVAADGAYKLDIRQAFAGTGSNGGTVHLESDGVDVSGPITLAKTGGWQTWQTVSKAGINLTAGQHVLTLVFDKDGTGGTANYLANINWIKLTSSAPVTQQPFPGPGATALPGTVEVENFDSGGQDVAYHDITPGNAGGQYRISENADIEKCSEGGYDVGWNQPGEWLEYTVNVATAGTYSLDIRSAYGGANASGGVVHVEADGVDVTGPITLAKTGGWQTWQTVSKAGVNLSAGQHVLKLVMDRDGAGSTSTSAYLGNINWFRIGSGGPSGSPVPGTLELENYDSGGSGVGYFDLTAGNTGGQYRTDNVDIEKCSEGGYDVGWNQPGEWLAYTVNVATTGTYTLGIRTAYGGANASGGTVHLESDGVDVSGPITLTKTGGWQTWATVTASGISLSAGQHVLKLVFDKDGAGSTANTAYLGNVNWVQLT